MSADLGAVVEPPRRVKAARIKVEAFRDGIHPLGLVIETGDGAQIVEQIERHAGGAVIGQAGNSDSLVGHVSTFRGESERFHDSASGVASKPIRLRAHARWSLRASFAGYLICIVMSWTAALYVGAWALSVLFGPA